MVPVPMKVSKAIIQIIVISGCARNGRTVSEMQSTTLSELMYLLQFIELLPGKLLET